MLTSPPVDDACQAGAHAAPALLLQRRPHFCFRPATLSPSHPPPSSAPVYACCLLGARTMTDTAFATVPRPLGYANLSDIPNMTVGGAASARAASLRTRAARAHAAPSSPLARAVSGVQDDDNFVCCVTETIFETKNKLFDCFIKGNKVGVRPGPRLCHACPPSAAAVPLSSTHTTPSLPQLIPSNDGLRSLFKVSSADGRRYARYVPWCCWFWFLVASLVCSSSLPPALSALKPLSISPPSACKRRCATHG